MMNTEENDIRTLLDKISPKAAREYFESEHTLLFDMNEWISTHPRRDTLLGRNSIDLLLDNNRNHHGFISEILFSRDGKLLEETLPWVYFTYHSQGIPFEYFIEELYMWCEVLKRHLSNESFTLIYPVYKWIIGSHEKNIELSGSRKNHYYQDRDDPFFKMLLSGDFRKVFQSIRNQINCWDDYEAFVTGTIVPSLHEVGVLWEEGQISVAEEHLVTALCNRLLSSLLVQIELPEVTRGRVLVSCVSDEYHQMGPWFIASVLEADGWDVDFIGVSSPKESLESLLSKEPYFAVFLGITMPYNIHSTIEIVQFIKKSYPGLKIICGGQAAAHSSVLESMIKCDLVTDNYKKAVRVLNEWYNGT